MWDSAKPSVVATLSLRSWLPRWRRYQSALDGHRLRLDPPRALPSMIGGYGRVHRLHAYSVDLPAHTYGRNRNSVALSCACMDDISFNR